MAADVGERTGPGSAPVAPGDRRGGVQRVVAPVVAVEVHEFADRARGELTPDLLDGGRPAVGVADGGDAVRPVGHVDHRLGIGERARKRLLAEHMLARRQQALDDLAVQMVGDHDADRVDVGGIGDGTPVVLRPLVAVALGGVVGDGVVRVGDGDQPDVRPVRAEQRASGAIAGRVRAARHAAADHGDPD